MHRAAIAYDLLQKHRRVVSPHVRASPHLRAHRRCAI